MTFQTPTTILALPLIDNPSFMDTISQHNDVRMSAVIEKIDLVEAQLTGVQNYLKSLGEEQSEEARKAISAAFQAGCEFSRLRHMPIEFPCDNMGHMQLGSGVKEHIQATRKVYARIAKLRVMTDKIQVNPKKNVYGETNVNIAV